MLRFQRVGSMFWIHGLFQFLNSEHGFCALVQCFESVLWFCALVLSSFGTVLSFCVLVLWFGSVLWLCFGSALCF